MPNDEIKDSRNYIVKNVVLTLEPGEIVKHYFVGTYVQLKDSTGPISLTQENSRIRMGIGDFITVPFDYLQIENNHPEQNKISLILSDSAKFGTGAKRVEGISDVRIINDQFKPVVVSTQNANPLKVEIEPTLGKYSEFKTHVYTGPVNEMVIPINQERIYIRFRAVVRDSWADEAFVSNSPGIGNRNKLCGGPNNASQYNHWYTDDLTANQGLWVQMPVESNKQMTFDSFCVYEPPR